MTEVDRRGSGRHGRIDSSEPAEQVAPDEHRGVRDRSDIADHVVLRLIEFAFLQTRIRGIEDICGVAHRHQPLRVERIDDLGSGHGCLYSQAVVDECRQRPRLGSGSLTESPDVVEVRTDRVVHRSQVWSPHRLALTGDAPHLVRTPNDDHACRPIHLRGDRFEAWTQEIRVVGGHDRHHPGRGGTSCGGVDGHAKGHSTEGSE